MRALLILLAGQAMAVMDGSILAVAAPSLRAGLHASDAQLQLVVAMYTIAFATLVVTGARLGDVLGRQRTFLLGLAGGGGQGTTSRGGRRPARRHPVPVDQFECAGAQLDRSLDELVRVGPA